MAKAIVAAGGGGGAGSDETNSTAGDVLKGKTYIGSDTDDEVGTGTLELTGNAGTGDVVASKTFYSTNPKSKQTGTLADKNGTTQSATASLDNTNSRLQMTIPATGRYNTSSKIYAAFSAIATLIGLTAAKLATGQKVLGITGSYKGAGNAVAADVRSGKTFSTGSLSNATGTMATQGGSTTTPGTANKTIVTATKCVTGNIIVAGASTLVAGNIKKNVTIFGVKGTFEGYVPIATDMYNRGNNAQGFTAKNWTSLKFDSGQITIPSYTFSHSTPAIYTTKTRNISGFTRFNIQCSIKIEHSSNLGGLTIRLGRGQDTVPDIILGSQHFNIGTTITSVSIPISAAITDNFIIEFIPYNSDGTWVTGVKMSGAIYRIWLS